MVFVAARERERVRRKSGGGGGGRAADDGRFVEERCGAGLLLCVSVWLCCGERENGDRRAGDVLG